MKTIALIDHHKGGHHFAFIKLFSKYLLKLGCRLCIYFPGEEQEILKYLKEEGADLTKVTFRQLNLKRKEVKFLGRLNYVLSTLSLWGQTRRILKNDERALGIKIDLVFFAWLDDHVVNDIPHQLVDFIFPYKWSGLFFHPWYLYDINVGSKVTITSRDSILKSKNCTSVAIHDEFVQAKLIERIHKKVVFFPEIADATRADVNYYLANELTDRANGRTIVSLIGISKRKGFLFLMDLILKANAEKFFFFFSGDITTHDFNEEEAVRVNNFLFSNLPENCFYYPTAIEEGAKINAIINTTDILFLVYNNFKSSSNFNTKAAIFNKMVLATNRFWIGRVTEKYKMGKAVDEGNARQMVEALEQLHDQLKEGNFNLLTYKDYLLIHREEALESAFQQILE